MFDRIKELSGGRSPTTIVNNALASGFYFNGNDRKHLADITPSDFTSQLSVSLLGSLNTLQASLPVMKSAKFGRIINIGTNLFQNPVVPYHDYTSAKAALLGFTRTSAAELGEFGVTVNMVSGGLLETTDASAVTPKEVFDTIRAISPLKKVCTPDEVADAVLFFASPWSRVSDRSDLRGSLWHFADDAVRYMCQGVTGQQLIVDGGLVMN